MTLRHKPVTARNISEPTVARGHLFLWLAGFALAVSLLSLPTVARAVAYSAADVLGQLSSDNVTPSFTTSGANNSPNSRGFNGPAGTALDAVNRRLFVADTNNNRVLVFNLDASNNLLDRVADNVLGQANYKANASTATQAGLNVPLGLIYDSAANRLFVADSGNNRILVFDVASITDGENAVNVLGQANFTSSGAAVAQNRLSGPSGLAYDSATQRLFVCESGNNRILVFDVASITDGENAVNVLGQANFTSSGAATTQSGLSYPRSLAYDSVGTRLFVGEFFNNRVTVFDVASITDGENAVNVLGQANFTSAAQATTQSGLKLPLDGLLYDSATSRLFVADSGNNRVTVFDVASITNGENAVNVLGQLNFTSSAAAANQSRLSSPRGFAYDSANARLFIADWGNSRVVVFDVATITDGENAVDLVGQLDDSDAPIYTKSAANNAPSSRGLKAPAGLELDPINHRLFVSEPDNNRVLVYNLDATNSPLDRVADNVLGQATFHTNANAVTQSGFSYPYGLVYDEVRQRLFVADNQSNRVLIFDVSSITDGENAVNVLGQLNFTSANAAVTQSGLSNIEGLTYDSANSRLFVADTPSNRILVFDVAAITDGENAVNVLGQPNFTSSASDTTQSALRTPRDLAYDSATQRLFVADSGNNRIMVFDVTTITDGENAVNVLGQTSFTTSGAGAPVATNLDGPRSLAYDSVNQRLFTSDTNNYRVLAYDVALITDGETAVNVLGQAGFTTSANATSQTGLNIPMEVAVDGASNALYVADQSNNRVMVYTFVRTTTASLPNGTVGAPYSQTVATTGSQGAVSLSVASGSLPPGLDFQGTTITGTPSATGTFSFTAEATDTFDGRPFIHRRSLTLTVAAACGNGLDDDADGQADFPADLGCTAADDTDETNPAGGGFFAPAVPPSVAPPPAAPPPPVVSEPAPSEIPLPETATPVPEPPVQEPPAAALPAAPPPAPAPTPPPVASGGGVGGGSSAASAGGAPAVLVPPPPAPSAAPFVTSPAPICSAEQVARLEREVSASGAALVERQVEATAHRWSVTRLVTAATSLAQELVGARAAHTLAVRAAAAATAALARLDDELSLVSGELATQTAELTRSQDDLAVATAGAAASVTGSDPLAGISSGAAVSFDGGRTWLVARGLEGAGDLAERLHQRRQLVAAVRVQGAAIKDIVRRIATLEEQRRAAAASAGERRQAVEAAASSRNDLAERLAGVVAERRAADEALAKAEVEVESVWGDLRLLQEEQRACQPVRPTAAAPTSRRSSLTALAHAARTVLADLFVWLTSVRIAYAST